jgi:hypothetical protein
VLVDGDVSDEYDFGGLDGLSEGGVHTRWRIGVGG